jgi:hypothetical protein
VYYTHRPLEWEQFMEQRLTAAGLADLKRLALSKWSGDIEGVLVRLAARAVAIGLETPKK